MPVFEQKQDGNRTLNAALRMKNTPASVSFSSMSAAMISVELTLFPLIPWKKTPLRFKSFSVRSAALATRPTIAMA
jgi:hypothetical protein